MGLIRGSARNAHISGAGASIVMLSQPWLANFDSLACRAARWNDRLREVGLRRPVARGRRHYDVPHDHFTRYELGLMREQASEALELDFLEGISLGWGLPAWTRSVGRLPDLFRSNLRGNPTMEDFENLARDTLTTAEGFTVDGVTTVQGLLRIQQLLTDRLVILTGTNGVGVDIETEAAIS